jgi:hypothetical protein
VDKNVRGLIAFMRQAIEDAGWHLTDQRDARRDKVQLEAERGTDAFAPCARRATGLPHAPNSGARARCDEPVRTSSLRTGAYLPRHPTMT